MGLTICLIMIYRISATERKIRRMHRMAGCSPSEASTAEATSPSPADAAEASDEERTRSLLGDELYDDMVWRVEEVLARHASDSSQTMLLDTGPESHEGHTVLHSLLPGDMLELEMLEDQAAVGVRAEGELIGLVHGGGARKVTRLMQLGLVTGAYVAEQNCYGMSDEVALKMPCGAHWQKRRYASSPSAEAHPPLRLPYTRTEGGQTSSHKKEATSAERRRPLY